MLRAARVVVFRKLGENDALRYGDHLARLAPDDRMLRFGHGSTPEGPTFPAEALVVGAFVGRRLRAVGELHPPRREGTSTAEAAFSVEAPWQDRGLGRGLLERIMLAARNRGLQRLVFMIAPGNGRMLHLARTAGARLDRGGSEIWATLELPRADAVTLLAERLEDGIALAAGAADLAVTLGRRYAAWRPGQQRRCAEAGASGD